MKQLKAATAATFMLATAAMLFGGGTAANAAAPAASGYVALGDSYASGVGAGSYDPASGECRRSSLSYPLVLDDSAQSFACAGAKVENVLGAGTPAEAQITSALADAGWVTITAGGNDVGFTESLTNCLFASDAGCNAYLDSKVLPYINGALPAVLDGLYASVRSKAPAADIAVVGYPRLFEIDGTCAGPTNWSQAKRQGMNKVADRLSEVIRQRAEAAGFTYVDTRAAFAGHGACGSSPWIQGLEAPTLAEAFHPNATGYAHLAALAPEHDNYVATHTGKYAIVNQASGLALDIGQDGAAVVQRPRTGSASQTWTFVSEGDGRGRVVNSATGRTLGIMGGYTNAGQPAIVFDSIGVADQEWAVSKTRAQDGTFDGSYSFKNLNSSQQLAIPGGTATQGQGAIQYPSTGGAEQRWTIIPVQ